MVAALMTGLATPAFSERINIEEAKNLASEFLLAQRIKVNGSLSIEPIASTVKASSPYYIFNVNGDKGFVIISAESSTNPVLGYSLENGYPVKNAPSAMKWVMEGMEKEVTAAATLQRTISFNERKLMAHSSATRGSEQKLLNTANWSQEGPFNNYIPGKALVGCVGTAMATIMKYYEWPANGTGSLDDTDFNTPYNWSEMRLDNYRSGYSSTEADAVAKLMYHASRSIDTQYGMSGSSAYEVKVPAALSTYFSYDPGVSYKKRADVATQEEWDKIVKNEIDEGRPVLYCGQDITAGHAFICDGYQGDYLHFNWGWGGSANGYFLSTALNPTVSKTHHYNNLNTIIYNIKPATAGNVKWSVLHITSDGNQSGIGSDMTDLKSGKSFSVRVGNLKNLSYSDFSGQIAVGLCDKAGRMKTLLSKTQSLNLQALGYLFNGYVDFKDCQLPSGVSVADDDKVCIVSLSSGENEWLPMAGELPTQNELSVLTIEPATFKINFPADIKEVAIEGNKNVIRGWNYTFNVSPKDGDENIITVKANGQIISGDASNNYTILNVREDQTISVLVQKASDVKTKKSVWVEIPGSLASLITESEAASLKELTLFGSVDARDFEYMRNAMKLTRLDISSVYIEANGTNQANAIPREAFKGCGSLKEVILPQSVNRLNNGCFRQCGITTINIPAGVKTYEYNVFCGASALRDIYVGREKAEFINWCVLSGVKTNLVTLHVPSTGAVNNYKSAENWNTIANIIVDKAIVSNNVTLAFAENPEVNFDCNVASGDVEKGTKITFSAVHAADNDKRMEVYANNTLLEADGQGKYSVSVDGNMMIHFNLVAPMDVTPNKSQWKLISQNGSLGLISEAVNVIPGQEFTVRVNAIDIPAGYDQLYWGMVLTDKDGKIKEFVSPVSLWTAGVGNNWKMNVNCKVKSSKVREGNTLRLATSGNRKNWSLVGGADNSIVDALQAVNNSNRIFNINIPEVADATVSGGVTTAIQGQDITLKISPNSASKRIDLIANGETVVKEAQVVNYTFIATQDMDFEIKVYNPMESGSVVYDVASGELYKALTPTSIRASVIIKGETYASDLANALRQGFAKKTIKKLDLSGLKIVADPTNSDYKENMIPSEMFFRSSDIDQSKPVVEEILLPNSVTRIGEAAFRNCEKLKEIRLPEDLSSNRVVVGQYSSGSPKYGYSIGAAAFDGCTSLTTIYIPGKPHVENGKMVVSHFNPMCSAVEGLDQTASYNLGHKVDGVYDASRTTIIVPEEYLSVYKAAYSNMDFGNPWQKLGYNILSENPVYSLNYDPTRCKLTDSGFDAKKAASFLGADVKSETITLKGKLALAHPEIKSIVYDNGIVVNPDADGTYPITFYNPAKNQAASGNHNIEVVYLLNIEFASTSPIFRVNSAESDSEITLNQSNPLAPVIEGIAENGTVKFKVDMSAENEANLEKHVVNGLEELLPDASGYYTVNLSDANCKINLYATPLENAVLDDRALASINPEETTELEDVALKGEVTTETISMLKECFPNVEVLDLSKVEGDLPEGAFSGMENLTTVILPEVAEIGKNMFAGCSNLTNIVIPSSVSSIEDRAFNNCSSLETITLTGVSHIGAEAFKGCDNLTSITLLADENAGMGTRGAAGFDSHAFDGLNPNCMIVVDEGVEAPSGNGNYLFAQKGMIKETLADGSVQEIEGRVFVASRPIILTDNSPLAIPFPFTLAKGVSISMEVSAWDWKGLVVPFNVEKITDENGIELGFSTGNIRSEEGCMAFTVAQSAEGLVASDMIKANFPYIFCAPREGKVTLSRVSGDIEASPAEVMAKGKDFDLYATFKGGIKKSSEIYVLNSSASAFEAISEDEVRLMPFEVFTTAPVEIRLPQSGYQTKVEEPTFSSSMKITKEGNDLVIYSSVVKDERIYSIDGKIAETVHLSEGRNVIAMKKGVYVIGGKKIVF